MTDLEDALKAFEENPCFETASSVLKIFKKWGASLYFTELPHQGNVFNSPYNKVPLWLYDKLGPEYYGQLVKDLS